jgi:hypothetical protein
VARNPYIVSPGGAERIRPRILNHDASTNPASFRNGDKKFNGHFMVGHLNVKHYQDMDKKNPR